MAWALMKAAFTGLVDMAIHMTDFFMDRIVEGLGKEATLRHTLTQGITSDKYYCAKLCTRTNSYAMCDPSLFANDTHTHQNCMELINNHVNSTLLDHYSQFSKYRVIMIIVFFIIMVVVFIICLRQTVFLLYCATGSLIRWFRAPKEMSALEESVKEMKLQVELANLKAYHKCIVDASADNRIRLSKKIK